MSAPAPTAAKTEWRKWARTLVPVPAPVAAAVDEHVRDFVAGVDGLVVGYEALPDEVSIDVPVDAVARLDRTGAMTLDTAHGSVPPHDIAAVLVPARVFDRDGYRLGRGGGHYDRLLPRLRAGTPVVGITCTARIVGRVPREPHDRPMTHLATEHGVSPIA